MKRKIDSESLPLKNWKKEAAMFQDDYTAGAGTSWLLNVAKAENKMIWEMIRAIEEAPILTPPNEALTLDELREMNEEPVWIQNLEEPAKSQWRLLYWDREKYLVLQGISVRGYLLEEYGESWLAYRRPPEEEKANNE